MCTGPDSAHICEMDRWFRHQGLNCDPLNKHAESWRMHTLQLLYWNACGTRGLAPNPCVLLNPHTTGVMTWILRRVKRACASEVGIRHTSETQELSPFSISVDAHFNHSYHPGPRKMFPKCFTWSFNFLLWANFWEPGIRYNKKMLHQSDFQS